MVQLQHRAGATIPNHRPIQEQNLESRVKRALVEVPHLKSSPAGRGEEKDPGFFASL
jgi:hypothetical protein